MDQQDYGNGVQSKYEYDGRGMISTLRHKKSANGPDLTYREYWRDERDRITAWRRGTESSQNGMEDGRGDRYQYDAEGQLTVASYRTHDPAGSAGDPLRGDIFSYDALGNRVRSNYLASRGWLDFTRKDNGLNQYSGWWNYSVTNYDSDLGGVWGSPGHANGVLMQDGWITGSYNALNQPVSMWSPAFANTTNWMWFGHDPLGRCVKRWIGPSGTSPNTPTYYYYDGWSLIQEGGSASNAMRVYVHGARVDEIVAQITSGNGWQRYFQYDARGHCTLQTDASGDIVEQYDYDGFGFPYFYNRSGDDIHSSPWGNRFLFTGREWISELRSYDFRNRMYQPELGRFLQPDPMEFSAGDYNLYRYCHNDPVNKTDPFGLVPPGEGLMDVPRDTLENMHKAMLKNAEASEKKPSYDGNGKPVKQEYRTDGYRVDGQVKQVPAEGPKMGYRDGPNRQPKVGQPDNPYGEKAKLEYITHSHIQGDYQHYGGDERAAKTLHVLSGTGHIGDHGVLMHLFVPSANGNGGAYFKTTDGITLRNMQGNIVPH